MSTTNYMTEEAWQEENFPDITSGSTVTGCYDYDGNNTACNSDDCIGAQCENSVFNGYYDPLFRDLDVPDAEGLWEFQTQEEFNDWFFSQYNFGEPFDLVNESADNTPWVISEDDAEKLTQLFHQYNSWDEMKMRTDYARDAYDAEVMNQIFEDNAEKAMVEDQMRAEELKNLEIRNIIDREDYDDEMDLAQNRNFKLELEERYDKIRSEKAKGNMLSPNKTLEEKLLAQEILDAFEDFTFASAARKNSTTDRINNMNQKFDANLGVQWSLMAKEFDAKEIEKSVALRAGWRNTANDIRELREQYDADIYNQLAGLISSGALFEYPPTFDWDNNAWDAVSWEEWEDGGMCRTQCGDDCTFARVCGPNEPQGNTTYIQGDCCDEPPTECEPQINLNGQCVACCD